MSNKSFELIKCSHFFFKNEYTRKIKRHITRSLVSRLTFLSIGTTFTTLSSWPIINYKYPDEIKPSKNLITSLFYLSFPGGEWMEGNKTSSQSKGCILESSTTLPKEMWLNCSSAEVKKITSCDWLCWDFEE